MEPPNLNGAAGQGKGHPSHLGVELMKESARSGGMERQRGRQAEADPEPLPPPGITDLLHWVLCSPEAQTPLFVHAR